ncbi:MAG: DUF4436 domain-containing protein [Actinomycetota bacterium]|uniref:DUF4436 domain-containing protein n=1 Tax=Mycobacterium lentiflavum TaxID=141349 RepID=A0ABY3UV28_MYCLN|nr:DUF4436 domain-containing protein [Mycobacterium lentiflavum]MEE3065222.1 DUF4436 domain-containing protein [Actinomycetota bacterium]ULP43400.1 DUF4436 domain-containing protein [Mycobacterium lentiflavum]
MSSRRAILGIVGVVLFVAAYAVSVWLYVDGGMGHPNVVVRGEPVPDATRVTIDIQEVQSANSLVVSSINVYPGPGLLDPQTHNLKEDLTIAVSSAVSASKRTWPKGTLPDVFRISLALDGEVAAWPFDEYHSGPVVAQLVSGPSSTRVPAVVTMVDRLLGWDVATDRIHEDDLVGPYQVDLVRSTSTVAFAVVILVVLIALAFFAFFVAVQTVRDKRKFQPPMTTWYAAMLFAVVPLRNALPDSPPIGVLIDVTIVLWVTVILVISMGLYVSCWWRHLRPEPDEPASFSSGRF